eukprot:TRINITY_DN60857_c0_g1_i1.p1 TRINITY_DN60857_c0_g1~~TRINITY_DN60857_c0_g1_i1.p1  ORF type:complete len:360 (-),score=34.88 TRINITY_DN60857_c0_g1_i1:287-1366(-)
MLNKRLNDSWIFALTALFVLALFVGSRRKSIGSGSFLDREAPVIYWLRSETGWPETLGLRSFAHSKRKIRGIASTVAIEKGEVVLSIPQDRLICASGNTDLTLEIVRLKREESVFSVYLDSLPTLEDYTHWHPFYASPALLQRFSILPLVKRIRRQLQYVNESYHAFGRDAGADWNTWQWAAHVVLTRNFGVEGQHCMVPGADLLNAAQTFNVNWNSSLQNRSDGKRYFEMKAASGIRRGEEMATTYGIHRSNEELFWQYGFFMESNEDLITSLDPEECANISDVDEIVARLCDDPSVECGLRRIYIGTCAYSVAFAYEMGLNRKVDLEMAHRWYAAALSEGDDSAREKVQLYRAKTEQ